MHRRSMLDMILNGIEIAVVRYPMHSPVIVSDLLQQQPKVQLSPLVS